MKVSIIVPVYNVEKYVYDCIKSIVNQTYKDIEIILVNDGSTDSSGKICDDWKQNDSRIKVIHKENGGISEARNSGIDIAIGDIYVFVDSDDLICNDMIETLVFYQQKYDADIVQAPYMEFINEEDINIVKKDIKSTVVTGIEAIKNIYDKNLALESTVVWNKAYKAKLFNKIRFPKGKIHEDEFTTYKLFYLSKKVAYIDKVVYLYRKRPGSIMDKGFSIKRFQWLEAHEERINFFDENIQDNELIERAIEVYGNRIMDYHYLLNKYYKKDKENANFLLQKAKKIKNRYLGCKTIKLTNKVKFLVWMYFYPIIYSLNRMRKKLLKTEINK